MKKHSWNLLAGSLTVGLIAIGTDASASLLVEPMLGGAFTSISVPAVVTSPSPAFGGGLRLGIEKDDLFTSIEGRYSFGGLGTTATNGSVASGGTAYTIGISAGGTLLTIPLRISGGFDFVSTYSDSLLELTGSAFHLELGYYLTEQVILSAEFALHYYTGISPAVTDRIQAGTYGASISFPLIIDFPTKPWRAVRQKESASAY